MPGRNSIINAGAVIAVLLGVPSFFIGLYGAAGVVTGGKLVGGTLGALWGYLATVGSYELNRRKFDWDKGRQHSDLHLLAGTVAVTTGLMVSGAIHETMPVLAIVPALSATVQANDGHEKKHMLWVHAAVLATGMVIGFWFYVNGVIGDVLLQRIAALP